MASLIGSAPNQISTNGMLGELAFMNSAGITVERIQSTLGLSQTSPTFTGATVTTNDFSNLVLQPQGGNVVVNGSGAALATTTTTGFLCITSCAGVPSGAPAAGAIPTGMVPMIVDSTNNRLYLRIGSTWRYATLT